MEEKSLYDVLRKSDLLLTVKKKVEMACDIGINLLLK